MAKREKTSVSRGLKVFAGILVAAAAILIGVAVWLVTSTQGAPSSGASEPSTELPVTEAGFQPPKKETTITISFAGDCTLGTDENFGYSSTFNAFYDEQGPDYFFSEVKDIFAADDLTVVNCEGVLTDATTREDKEYAYKGKPEYAEIFARSSIEAAGTWNNHSYDYGWNSHADTVNALEAAGVTPFGLDTVGYVEVKGIKIALINGNMLTSHLSEEGRVLPQIREAQDQGAQVIIVQMHWGEMSEYNPLDEQIQLAHDCIDAGATIVVGSHQHVLQGYEEYNGCYISYGLGNFCYGGSRGLFDPDCYIFQVTLSFVEDELQEGQKLNLIPCLISTDRSVNDYQPCRANEEESARIWGKIEDSNASLDR